MTVWEANEVWTSLVPRTTVHENPGDEGEEDVAGALSGVFCFFFPAHFPVCSPNLLIKKNRLSKVLFYWPSPRAKRLITFIGEIGFWFEQTLLARLPPQPATNNNKDCRKCVVFLLLTVLSKYNQPTELSTCIIFFPSPPRPPPRPRLHSPDRAVWF